MSCPQHAINIMVILLNLVHTGSLQLLAMFYILAANVYGFLPKTSNQSKSAE